MQIKNNISAIKSRIGYRLRNKKDAKEKRFAGYQSNFKLLVNMLSKIDCEEADPIRMQILKKINADSAV